MGWNRVKQSKAHPMWQGIEDNDRFYFVHSYFVDPEAQAEVVGTTDYPDPFCAAMAHKNVFAVQFHPEKSQRNGLQLLENFLSWNGQS
jgi:imidazole glycerol-phosphate synthase subunit HisH